VRLLKTGEFDLREYKDKRDWRTFLACLNLHNWRLDHDKELKKLCFSSIVDPIFVGAASNPTDPDRQTASL